MIDPIRISTDEQGFHTLRTGERDDAPDSDLIASVWNDDYLALFRSAPELLELVWQYRNDLQFPVAPDSKERRLAAIDAVLKKVEAA